MSCTQCSKPVIPSTVVVSDIPQNGALCDECNLKAVTEPEVVIADHEGFPYDKQDADMPAEAMVISGGGPVGSEELAPSAEPLPVCGTEIEFALDEGDVEDCLSPNAYANVQCIDVHESGAFDENGARVACAVFASLRGASEALSLSSRLEGGMGGAADRGRAYGEITAGSIAAVLGKLEVDNRDIFIDVGSGIGAVVAVGSELRNAKASVGLESDRNRAYISQVFLHKMISQAQHAEGQHDSENSIPVNARVVASHADALLFTDLQPATKGYCFSTGMASDVQDGVSKLMTSTTTMQRFIIFHPVGENLLLRSHFVLLESGTATLVRSSATTTTWYMYGRKGGDGDGDDDDDDPVIQACAECNTNGELVACSHCSALFCSSHASVGKHNKNMCKLSYFGCDAGYALAYLTEAINAFGDLPERFSWTSETTPSKTSTDVTLLVS
jgi:Histone methylation protein DOT1